MLDAPEGGAQVIDLMEALRASLETRKPAKRAQPAPAAARKSAKK
jgi:DNA end-binding protein Ku